MYKKLWICIFVLFGLVCSGCFPNSSNAEYVSTETDAIIPSMQTLPSNDSEVTQFPTQDLILQEIDEGKKQGDNIVNAIEKYYENEGDYPESLADLLPNYLDEIPVTITQKAFSYELSDYYTLDSSRKCNRLISEEYLIRCLEIKAFSRT
ncbi:MAG: hypothetical protein HOJ31_06910 [Anaerolineae bacterium]|nr:hypothetical protein [Anaerolineae bacterium]